MSSAGVHFEACGIAATPHEPAAGFADRIFLKQATAMRRVFAAAMFVLGIALAVAGLACLFEAGFIVVTRLIWDYSTSDAILHDEYFEIGGEPVSAAVFYLLLFTAPVAFLGAGVGLTIAGRSVWKGRRDQGTHTAIAQ
jgi:hypothetical protein